MKNQAKKIIGISIGSGVLAALVVSIVIFSEKNSPEIKSTSRIITQDHALDRGYVPDEIRSGKITPESVLDTNSSEENTESAKPIGEEVLAEDTAKTSDQEDFDTSGASPDDVKKVNSFLAGRATPKALQLKMALNDTLATEPLSAHDISRRLRVRYDHLAEAVSALGGNGLTKNDSDQEATKESPEQTNQSNSDTEKTPEPSEPDFIDPNAPNPGNGKSPEPSEEDEGEDDEDSQDLDQKEAPVDELAREKALKKALIGDGVDVVVVKNESVPESQFCIGQTILLSQPRQEDIRVACLLPAGEIDVSSIRADYNDKNNTGGCQADVYLDSSSEALIADTHFFMRGCLLEIKAKTTSGAERTILALSYGS